MLAGGSITHPFVCKTPDLCAAKPSDTLLEGFSLHQTRARTYAHTRSIASSVFLERIKNDEEISTSPAS